MAGAGFRHAWPGALQADPWIGADHRMGTWGRSWGRVPDPKETPAWVSSSRCAPAVLRPMKGLWDRNCEQTAPGKPRPEACYLLGALLGKNG